MSRTLQHTLYTSGYGLDLVSCLLSQLPLLLLFLLFLLLLLLRPLLLLLLKDMNYTVSFQRHKHMAVLRFVRISLHTIIS